MNPKLVIFTIVLVVFLIVMTVITVSQVLHASKRLEPEANKRRMAANKKNNQLKIGFGVFMIDWYLIPTPKSHTLLIVSQAVQLILACSLLFISVYACIRSYRFYRDAQLPAYFFNYLCIP